MSQFTLLRKRRFLPFFITQSLGAFNDNVFKQALVILLVFDASLNQGLTVDAITNLAAGLFILPFFLFSATAGQVADKFEKSVQIRRIKLLEVAIMLLATLGFWLSSLPLLLAVLFLMGTQSTLFGPIKYGILPQHLEDSELVGGNGLVEMGTFLAILVGMIVGGALAALGYDGRMWTAAMVVTIAILGYLASRAIPRAKAVDPDLKINFNPITQTWKTVKLLRMNLTVFRSVLGISWFWLFGATFLTQVPNYARVVLGGDEMISVLLMTLFSLGIGIGSLACEKLSHGRVEIGLVPFGAIGLTLLTIDTWFATPYGAGATSVMGFLSEPSNWRICIDLMLIGTFGGFYIVPLYAMIQQRSEPRYRSRIIAGNNILNALFMTIGAVLAGVVLSSGMTIPQLFLVTGILNAMVALYIFLLVPEFLLRFISWILLHLLYRTRHYGLEKIPEEGPALLVSNHISFIDWLVLLGLVRRPVRFVMYYKIFKIPVVNWAFRAAGAIPISGQREDARIYHEAFERIQQELDAGHLVCIFPEGRLSPDGQLQSFKSGVEKILKTSPVDVYPMALHGLWGSMFSRKHQGLSRLIPRRFMHRVTLRVGDAIAAKDANVKKLHAEVDRLGNYTG